jgi:predicted metallo-beta-lactamase superfamily hydrolase
MSKRTLEFILDTQPSMLMLGGPPFYLEGYRVNKAAIQTAVNNLKSIVEKVPLVIVEHHMLRDEFWKQKVAPINELAVKAGHGFLTAAEYVGVEDVFLESKRKLLFRENPPSKEFQQWMKTLSSKQITKPPI